MPSTLRSAFANLLKQQKKTDKQRTTNTKTTHNARKTKNDKNKRQTKIFQQRITNKERQRRTPNKEQGDKEVIERT